MCEVFAIHSHTSTFPFMQKYLLLIAVALCSCQQKNAQETTANKAVQADSQNAAIPVSNVKEATTTESTANASPTNTKQNSTSKMKMTPKDVSKEYLLGKFEYRGHDDFNKIESKYTSKSDIYIRKETYAAFKEMYDAALKEGVKLVILSATRNFNEQKSIWEGKWTGKIDAAKYMKFAEGKARAEAILSFSSMPCTSRHHWGTDMDFNNLNNPYFEKGEGKKIYDWLVAHAWEYGFCNVYSEKGANRPNGYNEEKWHWSYLPLAKGFLAQYREKVDYSDITGFAGSEVGKELNVIENYVGGINPNCQ